MKLARCARSDSHSVRALRAVKSHPFGAGLHSNGRGAAPVLDCWFSGGAAQTQYKMFLRTSRGVKCGACCEVCGSGPSSFETLQRMPVEDLCRRFRVSLVCDVCAQAVRTQAEDFPFISLSWKLYVAALRLPCLFSLYAGGAETDECFSFLSCSWNFCVARFACIPCTDVSLHDEAGPHRTKNFLVICGSAFFVGATSAKGSRRRRDAKPCGNTGTRITRARRSSPGSSC